MDAVVCAFHFQNLVTSGDAACQTDGMHSRFRAAVAEADLLDGEAGTNFLRQLAFQFVGHAEHGPQMQPFLDGFDHGGMAMTGHQSAKAEIEIQILMTV